jgi:hypothetical protein
VQIYRHLIESATNVRLDKRPDELFELALHKDVTWQSLTMFVFIIFLDFVSRFSPHTIIALEFLNFTLHPEVILIEFARFRRFRGGETDRKHNDLLTITETF